MIITRVRACAIEVAFPQPFAYLRKWYEKGTAIIVEIETDRGLIGRGGCQGPARAAAEAITTMTPWLIGQNPLQPTLLRQSIYARLGGDLGLGKGLTGIYAALWEIKDKQHLLSITPAAWSGRLIRDSLPAARIKQIAESACTPALRRMTLPQIGRGEMDLSHTERLSSAASGASGAAGSQMVTVSPPDTPLAALTVPPCAMTARLAMARPSP